MGTLTTTIVRHNVETTVAGGAQINLNRSTVMKSPHAFRMIVLTSAAALALAAAQAAFAQSDAASLSRGDVKAQTRAANKSSELWRGGEAPLPSKPFASEKTRIDRKSEAIAARRAGELKPAGEADYRAHVARPARTDKTRVERKAETLAAAKSGTLSPSGEGGDAAPKVPMK
jgi:hypothetical protein